MAEIKVPVALSGVGIAIRCIEKFRSEVEWTDEASEDYRKGVNDAFEGMINALKMLQTKYGGDAS